jgi:hypothetical protein
MKARIKKVDQDWQASKFRRSIASPARRWVESGNSGDSTR